MPEPGNVSEDAPTIPLGYLPRLKGAISDRYDIERKIGAGGMATVYLARDLKHNRSVALKVLKPELAAVVGAERFLAEIRTTANLQHPHILPLFDSGEAEGFLFYVMPYVEGESLRGRLDRERQLPVGEAVQLATGVAEALDYAHRQGVIHRDIKPGNILLLDGKPVIADFGIALAVGAAGGGRLTETGLSLGTPHYASPEQATGDHDIGPAADIYALGCVLYEMLAGEPPYTGTTAQVVLGKIVTAEPKPVMEHRRSVPANVDATIRKALQKVPADRFGTAAEIASALADPRFEFGVQATRRAALNWPSAGWAAVGVALGATVATLVSGGLTGPTTATTLFPLRTPEGVRLFYDGTATMAVAPDGSGLVYVGEQTIRRLYWQDLREGGDARPIQGTDGAASPFVSPDGRWIGYRSGGTLYKVGLQAGEPVPLAPAPNFRGGSWSADGESIFFVSGLEEGIRRIPSDGGEPVPVATEEDPMWPVALPDGRGLLYTSFNERQRVMHLDLETGASTELVENAFYGRYAPSGHLVFAQAGSLLAARFDLGDLSVGEPTEIVPDAITGNDAFAEFGISDDGTFAYLSGPSAFERRLVRIDREGNTEVLVEEPQPIMNTEARLSPAGDLFAVSRREGKQDLFLYDLERGSFTRLTAGDFNNWWPVWTRDGTRLAHDSNTPDGIDIYVTSVDGTVAGELLYGSEFPKWPHSWGPGDTLLAYMRQHPTAGFDVMVYSTESDEARAFRDTEFNEWYPVFSPDGQHIAYVSDRSGSDEVYVAPFNESGAECRVSASGGRDPRWSDSGELFYRQSTSAMVVAVADLFPECDPQPIRLFDGLEDRLWDVSASGDFFVTGEVRPEPRLFLTLNWLEELERLVPD